MTDRGSDTEGMRTATSARTRTPRGRGRASSPRFGRRLSLALVPTWTTLVLATAATLWTVHREWRTWTTGGQHEWTEFHFFWPWYTWSHTDHVVGPSSFFLTLDVLTGVALWYLPAAVVVAGLRRGLAAVPVPGRDRFAEVARVVAFHPLRGVGVLLFGVVASALPPLSVSLFTLPGALLLVGLHTSLGSGYVEEPTYAWTVPLAYLAWYGVAAAVSNLYRVLGRSGAVTGG